MTITQNQIGKLHQVINKTQQKRKKSTGNVKRTDKQRRIDHLDEQQQKNFEKLRLQLGRMILDNTFIESKRKKKNEDVMTKKDMQKSGNVKDGFLGIHSEKYLKDVLDTTNQFIKYCIETENIKNLRDIKPRMAEAYCRSKIENAEWSFRTLQTKTGHLQKIAESASKRGLMKFKKLVNNNTLKLQEEFKPQGTRKENRKRNRKADGSTMTVREARVISKHMESGEYGIFGKATVDFLTESGLRAEEIMKLRWSDIDFDNNIIYLMRQNMTKTGRERIVMSVSDKTLKTLDEIRNVIGIKNGNQTVFRHIYKNAENLRRSIKTAAKQGKVAYLGLHAFRSASKEYQKKQLEKTRKKYITQYGQKQGKVEYKKFLVNRIMKHVSISGKLNPMMNNGKLRYNEETLLNKRLDRLEHDVLTQNYGHNRRSVLSQYG